MGQVELVEVCSAASVVSMLGRGAERGDVLWNKKYENTNTWSKPHESEAVAARVLLRQVGM